jgi:hypothetical protein
MTITLTREEAQQVLNALEQLYGWDTATQGDIVFDPSDEIETLRARLSAPEPEPVAWFMEGTFMDGSPSFIQVCETDPEFYTPLYRAPQREWQGLTDEEIMSLLSGAVRLPPGWSDTVQAIEAKLKEKNT